jgi:hypothetical protein
MIIPADGAATEANMSPTSLRSERLILADPTDPRLPRNVTHWDRVFATLTHSELVSLIIVCAIGLLVTAAMYLVVPNFGETVASLEPFL